MKRNGELITVMVGLLMAANTCVGDTNLVITSFDNGMLSWTNTDSNLYYSVQWKPSLTGSNEWSASYRSCQDLQSTNQIITVPVPAFFRIWGSSNPAHTSVISPSNNLILAGYYEDTDLTEIDPDLVSENIRAGITVFGVTGKTDVVDTSWADAEDIDIQIEKTAWVKGVRIEGTRQPSPVRKTGQTISFHAGDDGDLQSGLAWPNPRFTVPDGEPDCIFDHLTGLLWLMDANPGGSKGWNNAIDHCTGLSAGLHDNWRMPTVQELQSLIDFSQSDPALPSGHSFTNVQSSNYWAATTCESNTNSAWCVDMSTGAANAKSKTNSCYVLPVCGGQPGFRLVEWYYDRDGDRYGSPVGPIIIATVQPSPDYVSNNLDPDDGDPKIP